MIICLIRQSTRCPENPGAFSISQTNATGVINIQQQVKTMTGDSKPYPAADCSLDVASIGSDDGLDAGAEIPAALDDVGV